MPEYIQQLILHLDNGKRVQFTGRVQINPEDKIIGIEISVPLPLPSHCHFEEFIVGAKEEKYDVLNPPEEHIPFDLQGGNN